MKYTIYMVVVLITTTPLIAQEKSEAELLAELSKRKEQDKAQVYYALSDLIYELEPERSKEYIHEGMRLANKLSDRECEMKGEIRLGRHNIQSGDLELGMDRLLKVLHSDVSLTILDSANLYSELANSLVQLGAAEIAVDYRKKVLEIKLRAGDSDEKLFRRDVYFAMSEVAYAYLMSNQYDSSNYYYVRSKEYTKNTGEPQVEMHWYNNMGWNYYLQNRWKDAENVLSQGTALFEKVVNPVENEKLIGAMLYRNLSIALQGEEYHEAARKAIIKSTEIINSAGMVELLTRNDLLTAECDLALHDYTSAKKFLDRAEQRMESRSDKQHYYKVLSEYCIAVDDAFTAANALKTYIEIFKEKKSDHIRNTEIRELYNFQIQRVKDELTLERRLNASEQSAQSLTTKLYLSGAATIIIVVLVLFFKYMSNKKKKELLLEAELGYKCRDLTDFALDIKRKQEFIDEVLKKLNGLKFSNEPEATSVRETIQLVKSQQLIDSNLKTFQENIDQVNHEYMDKLRERYPNLTKGETELCALLRLRLSTKEIALAKNISPGSVKTLRYRLRKKLNISQDTDLVAHLSKLA